MRNIYIILVTALLFTSCGPGVVTLQQELKFNDQEFNLGQDYTLDDGSVVNFSTFELFLGDITLDAKEDVLLSDIQKLSGDPTKIQLAINTELKAKSIEKLKFGLGVPANLNAVGPQEYPAESPLSYVNSDNEYWSWAMGYIFFKLEGKYKDSATDPVLKNLLFHIGLDQNYLEKELNLPITELNSKSSFNGHLKINLATIFNQSGNEIILSNNENYTQSEPEFEVLNQKIMDNLSAGITIE